MIYYLITGGIRVVDLVYILGDILFIKRQLSIL